MKKLDAIKKFTEELLEKLGFDVTVSIEQGEENTVHINIDGEELGALIGHHGETLNSLQHILGLVATQKLGAFTHVQLDAGQWRKNREMQLEQMAQHAIERVEQSGKDYDFPPMSPQERRLIHIYISGHSNLFTHSSGEGNYRHIVVSSQDTGENEEASAAVAPDEQTD